MKRIDDIREVQRRLLAIACQLHRICTEESIPYYMIGGTMLGAIRHKGFIPWDDDMDFGVPRAHYDRLIEALERKLPEPYRCLTHKNCKQIKYPFLKIEDRTTCIDDRSLDCPLEEMPGLNIDVFPIDQCDRGGWRIWRIKFFTFLQTLFFVRSTSRSKWKAIVKRGVMAFAPHDRLFFISRLEHAMTHAGNGNYMGNLIGRIVDAGIIPVEVYQELCDYTFEDTTLRGFKKYDEYLAHVFGDYMQLPPETDRQTHVDNVYER